MRKQMRARSPNEESSCNMQGGRVLSANLCCCTKVQLRRLPLNLCLRSSNGLKEGRHCRSSFAYQVGCEGGGCGEGGRRLLIGRGCRW